MFRSCTAVRIPDDIDLVFNEDIAVGSFFFLRQVYGVWSGRVIWCRMPYTHPCGADSWHSLRIVRPWEPKPPKPFWLWNGNHDKPTIKPSIRCGPKGETHWHGYLTAGVFAACKN